MLAKPSVGAPFFPLALRFTFSASRQNLFSPIHNNPRAELSVQAIFPTFSLGFSPGPMGNGDAPLEYENFVSTTLPRKSLRRNTASDLSRRLVKLSSKGRVEPR
jgi:hypothetical protein